MCDEHSGAVELLQHPLSSHGARVAVMEQEGACNLGDE